MLPSISEEFREQSARKPFSAQAKWASPLLVRGRAQPSVCVRSSDGTIIEERRHPTRLLGRYLKGRPPSRVIVESFRRNLQRPQWYFRRIGAKASGLSARRKWGAPACRARTRHSRLRGENGEGDGTEPELYAGSAEAFAVADQAKALGHEVRVVPSSLARPLGIGARRIKNDRRDAQVLSEVSTRIDLPSVHIKSTEAREQNSICSTRESMSRARTQLINCVRGFARTRMIRIRSGGAETFPTRARQAMLGTPQGVPTHVERVLVAIEAITAQLRDADKELKKIGKESETCRRLFPPQSADKPVACSRGGNGETDGTEVAACTLMTVPGVGPVTAVRFSAALDTVKRFRSAHSVGSYLGLTPGEDSSSTRERRLSITKAGPPHVRWTLTQACWSAVRTRPNDPMVVWAKDVEKRRGKRIAITALARKMAGILFALWRDGSTYKPNHETEKSKKTERSGVGK